MNRALDYLKNELQIGDTVVFMQIGYRGLMKGTIISLSEQKATITHEPTNTYRRKSVQFHNQMIKIS